MTRTQLLAEVEAVWVELQSALAPLDEARVATVMPGSEWAIRDVFPHISFWEDRLVLIIRAFRGEATLPEPIESADVDRLNARVVAASRERTLAVILEGSRRSHAAALREIEALSDDDLLSTVWSPWANGRPLRRVVETNTVEHYREHLEAVRAATGGA